MVQPVKTYFHSFQILFILTLFLAGCPFVQANESDPRIILHRLPLRQQNCLQAIADDIASPTPARGAALLFLNEQIERANQCLLEFKGDNATLPDWLVVLRILRRYSQNEDQLTKPVQSHLEKEVEQFIKKQGTEFLTPLQCVHLNEHQEIIRLSMLIVWANHVEQNSLPYRWPGKPNNKQYRALFRKEVHRLMDRWGRYGFSERNSPYYTFTFGALLNLRDCGADESIQKKAEMCIDWLAADIAQESLGALWGGPRLLAYEAVTPLSGNQIHYILFGHPSPSFAQQTADPLTLLWCETDYRPPLALFRLGYEREKRGSYEVKIRYCKNLEKPETNGAGIKYSYVTPRYILGSFTLRNQSVPPQTRPWDLLIWDETSGYNHFFAFTGDRLFSGIDPTLNEPHALWNATCFQYKNVLYFQYHRSDWKQPGSGKTPGRIDRYYEQFPTRFWIPNSFDGVTEDGAWWFTRIDSLYLAFRPISGKSYWWRDIEFGEGAAGFASILSFLELETAFVLEVEEAERFSSFDQFKQQVIEAPFEADRNSISFVSRQSDVFLFPRNDGSFLVNGKEIDPINDSSYDLFSSPFVHSQYGSGVMKVDWPPDSVTLDFRDTANPKRIITGD